jgi:hydrogenase expression/formation protein HypC
MCLGIPSQIVEISDATQMRAKVDVDGVRSEVSVALLGLEGPEAARVGDWVLVHVGFVIERISEEEAHATLEGLAQLRDMYEQELPAYSADVEGATRVVSPS